MSRHTERAIINDREYLIINWHTYYPLDVFTVEEALADYNTKLLTRIEDPDW